MTLNALHRISLSMLLAVLLVGCIDAEEFDSTTDVAVTVDSSSADGDAGASDIVTPPDDAPERVGLRARRTRSPVRAAAAAATVRAAAAVRAPSAV